MVDTDDKMIAAWQQRGYFCMYVVLKRVASRNGRGKYAIPYMNFHGETECFNSKKAARDSITQLVANSHGARRDFCVVKLGVIS